MKCAKMSLLMFLPFLQGLFYCMQLVGQICVNLLQEVYMYVRY